MPNNCSFCDWSFQISFLSWIYYISIFIVLHSVAHTNGQGPRCDSTVGAILQLLAKLLADLIPGIQNTAFCQKDGSQSKRTNKISEFYRIVGPLIHGPPPPPISEVFRGLICATGCTTFQQMWSLFLLIYLAVATEVSLPCSLVTLLYQVGCIPLPALRVLC